MVNTSASDRIEGHTYYTETTLRATAIMECITDGMDAQLTFQDVEPGPARWGDNYKITIIVEKM